MLNCCETDGMRMKEKEKDSMNRERERMNNKKKKIDEEVDVREAMQTHTKVLIANVAISLSMYNITRIYGAPIELDLFVKAFFLKNWILIKIQLNLKP